MKLTSKIKFLNALGLFNIIRSLYYGLDTLNADILKFYQGFIREGDLCFDVGANIGRKTDIFLKLGARVVAVEPNPECFKFLEWKYRRRKNVILVPHALDAESGRKEMFVCEANALSSLSPDWIRACREDGRYAEFHWDKKITIETTTLEELIRIYGKPIFCKVDVEGYELNVIKGLQQPIPAVSLELAPESLNQIIACLRRLAELGKIMCNYTGGERAVKFELPQWLSWEKMIEFLLALPKGRVFGELYVQCNHENRLMS